MAPRRKGLRERPQSPRILSVEEKKAKARESNIQRCKRYRERIKDDPELAQIQRAKDQERSRQNRRLPKTEDERARERELARQRMAKSRAKKKAEAAAIVLNQHVSAQSQPRSTRARDKKEAEAVKAERAKWATYKRAEREKWTAQKWRRHREKNRKRYHSRKYKESCPSLPQGNGEIASKSTPHESAAPYTSKAAMIKARYRLKKALLGLQKFSGLFRKKSSKVNTPQTKTLKENLSTELQRLKKTRTKEAIAKRKLLFNLLKPPTEQQPEVDVQKLYIRKKKHSGVAEAVKFMEDAAIPLSSKRSVSKRDGKQRKVLPKRMKGLHKEFAKFAKGCKVSMRSMYRHKPSHIRTNKAQLLRQSLCEVCVNFDLLLDTLNRHMDNKIDGRDSLSEMSLCTVPTYECIERECTRCGIQLVEDKITQEVTSFTNIPVTWYTWKLVKKEKGQRREKVQECGSQKDLIRKLLDSLTTLSKHIFVHRWQHTQYRTLLSRLPSMKDTAVAVFDFAENYLCGFQDEVQSAHWGYNQVTVHPCVLYYPCSCGELVTEYIVMLSDDLLHDAHMVRDITTLISQHLKTKKRQNVVIFSDGCSSQYKSKLPFFFTAEQRVEWVFFGSRHGKSACDACGGVVKSLCDQDVRDGAEIQSAKAMFKHLSEHHCLPEFIPLQGQCCHTIRSFRLLEDVKRELSSSALKTVPGTRRIQHVKGLGECQLITRNLTCFCDGCLGLSAAPCPASHVVKPWAQTNLIFSKTRPELEEDEEDIPVPPVSSAQPIDRQKFFTDLQKKLEAAPDFAMLEGVVKGSVQDMDKFSICAKSHNFITGLKGAAVDAKSIQIMPSNTPPRHFPIVTSAQGNCLPCALSWLAFGCEDNHIELRVRLVFELVINAAQYVSPAYLAQGSQSPGDTLLQMLIDDVDIPDRNGLSPIDILRAEVFAIRKLYCNMSMWAVYAAANVMKAPIVSIHPTKGELAKQLLANRTIMPTTGASTTPCCIMWTSNREDMIDRWWLANHFVPLLPLHPEEGAEVEEDAANTAFVVEQEDAANIITEDDEEDAAKIITEDDEEDAANLAFIEEEDNRFPVEEDFYRLRWADGKQYVCQDAIDDPRLTSIRITRVFGDFPANIFFPRFQHKFHRVLSDLDKSIHEDNGVRYQFEHWTRDSN